MLKKNLFLCGVPPHHPASPVRAYRKALPKEAVFLLAFLILAFFLVSLCMSVSGVVAKEPTTLQKSPFVTPEIKNIDYDEVYGTEMVKNGSEVSIKVVLTNISKEIDKSTLIFYSELVGAEGHIREEVLKSGSPYTLEHKEVEEEVVVIWSGTAPEVRKRTPYLLLNITQETTEGEYLVVDIKRDVTSEISESAIIAIDEAREKLNSANLTIANATEKGIDVSEADTTFETASLYFKDAEEAYWDGWPKESVEAATNASYYAELAKQKAESAVGAKKHLNYGGLAVVAIIAIVVIVFLNRVRRRKRGIY